MRFSIDGRELGAGHRLARRHEDGVIPGDGADDVRQRRPVDGAGQVVRRAGRGAQHGEVPAGVGGHQQLAQQPRQAFGATGYPAHRAAVLGHDVDADAAVGAAQLHRAELLEVARQRGLGDVDAFAGEQRGQLALAAHRSGRQDRHDAGLPAGPGHFGSGLRPAVSHRDRSSSHTSSAFCACSRFSASSHTALCGPSITSSVISCPRCAGRQCSTMASGAPRPAARR